MWLSGHCEGLVVQVGEYILSTNMLVWLMFVFQHKLLTITKSNKKDKIEPTKPYLHQYWQFVQYSEIFLNV